MNKIGLKNSSGKNLYIYSSLASIFLILNILFYILNMGLFNVFSILVIALSLIASIVIYKIIIKYNELDYKYHVQKSILNNSSEGIIIFNSDFEVLKDNSKAKKLLGEFYKEDNLKKTLVTLLNCGDMDIMFYILDGISKSETGEALILKNYLINERYINISVKKVYDLSYETFIIRIFDNSEQFKNNETIDYLSNYDTLTYLPKRNFLKEDLDSKILNAKKNLKIAVMFIDLDRFKNINDSYGYLMGDKVIVNFSNRLKDTLRKDERYFQEWFLGRSSADEFILLLYNYSEFSDVSNLINDIIVSAKEPYFIDDIKVHVSCSIGVAFYPENGSNSEELVKNASVALFSAKKLGGDMYQIYENSIYSENKGAYILEEKIKDAIEDGEIDIYLQPIIDIREKVLSSAEVLARWTDKEGNYIRPDEFIPVLEKTGLIKKFDVYIAKKAIEFIKDVDNSLLPPISINISAKTYRDLKVIQEIEEIITESNLSDKVRLEITETTAMSNVEYSKFVIGELSKSGLKMLLDDFGSGYSSLRYLRDFSFDIVKIDKELVRGVDKDTSVYSVLKACVTMGRELGFEVLAEGVEHGSELESLEELEFKYVQGYFFSKPISKDEFINYVDKFEYKKM